MNENPKCPFPGNCLICGSGPIGPVEETPDPAPYVKLEYHKPTVVSVATDTRPSVSEECRSEPRPDCGFVRELAAQLADRAVAVEGLQRALEAATRERDFAQAYAKVAEEKWLASQREAEALGRMLAAQGVGLA